jgi:hypothetical protein
MMANAPARNPVQVLYSRCAAAKAKLAERASHISTGRILEASCEFNRGSVKWLSGHDHLGSLVMR